MSEREDLQNFIEFCDSKFGKKVMRAEANFIKEQLKGRNHILDVGCGIGIFEQLLPDLDITGLDSSEVFLEEARRRSNKKFVPGKAEDLPFEGGSFDAVFSVTTLEFLDNYEKIKKAAREMHRVLKPGGKIVIMLLNPKSQYFQAHAKRKNSYFNRMRFRNIRDIRNYFIALFELEKGERYFLGIVLRKEGDKILSREYGRAEGEKIASLYVIIGRKE